MSAAKIIGEHFSRLSNKFAKSETGGFLNYILKPVRSNVTGKLLLEESALGLTEVFGYIKDIVFNPIPSTRVLNILPPNVHPDRIENNLYGAAFAMAVAVVIISLLIFLTILLSPVCCLQRRVGRRDESAQDTKLSKVQTKSYFVLATATLVSVIYIALCTTTGFLAVASLSSGIHSNETAENKPVGVNGQLTLALKQSKLFLQEFVQEGRVATQRLITGVSKQLETMIPKTILDIMNSLYVNYGVERLLHDLRSLSELLTVVLSDVGNMTTLQASVLTEIENFQVEMDIHQATFRSILQNVCGLGYPAFTHERCSKYSQRLDGLSVVLVISSNWTEPMAKMPGLLQTFGGRINEVLSRFTDLRQHFSANSTSFAGKVMKRVNLEEMSQPVLSVWNNLESGLVQRLKSKLNYVTPYVKIALKQSEYMSKLTGYSGLAVAVTTSALIIVYLFLCGLEARRKGFIQKASAPSGRGLSESRCIITCGKIVPVFLGGFLLLFIFLATLLTTTAIVLNGEVCRYLYKPSASRLTDAVIDMYLQYKLDNWINGAGIPPSARELIALTPIKSTFNNLLIMCRPSLGEVTPKISLLHSLGIKNLVNISAFSGNKRLQDIIESNYQTVAHQILGMNFGSYVPNDLKDMLQRAQNVSLILTSLNYTDTLNDLRKSPIDLQATYNLLVNLDSDIKRATSLPAGFANPQFKRAERTIDAVRKQLRNLGPITQNADLLAQSIEKLRRHKSLSDHMRKVGVSLDTTVKTLTDPKLLEASILPAYKNATQSLLANLTSGLDTLTTEFTGAVASCNRLHYVVNSVIRVSCSKTGLVNRLGGTSCIFCLLFFPLMLTTFSYQSFLILHEHLYAVSLK